MTSTIKIYIVFLSELYLNLFMGYILNIKTTSNWISFYLITIFIIFINFLKVISFNIKYITI